jgi:hypothetical protein
VIGARWYHLFYWIVVQVTVLIVFQYSRDSSSIQIKNILSNDYDDIERVRVRQAAMTGFALAQGAHQMANNL